MKVLLLGNYASDRQESMQRFAQALFDGLQSRGLAVEIIRPRRALGGFGNPHRGLAKWCGYVDKFVLFPVQLRQLAATLRKKTVEPTVIHICDQANAIYTGALSRLAHVVTCCDLLAIRSARGEIRGQNTKWFGRQLQRRILAGLNQTQRVTCISEATRRDLLRLSTLDPNAVDVTHMGFNYPYSPMELGQARAMVHDLVAGTGGPHAVAPFRPYLLHVGGNQWYKNRLGVLRIYHRLHQFLPHPPRLIMAGKALDAKMTAFVREKGLSEHVISIQDSNSEQLRALYSAAELLLFPSVLEGFGWPITEAQACGCRVITTHHAPMTEAGGDAALYVDPNKETNVARQTALLLSQPEAGRQELQRRGLANAARFSTDAMIDNYMLIYRELVHGKQELSNHANSPRGALG